MARATEMCILVLFDTARSAASRDVIQAVAAATTISSRTPEQQREYGENCQRVVISLRKAYRTSNRRIIFFYFVYHARFVWRLNNEA